MAGDWIKMRTDLRSDPAVVAIASAIGLDEDTVVGKLHRLWSWADKHTSDGNALVTLGKRFGNAEVTPTSWLDRYVCVPGFASALIAVGWLEVSDDVLTIPNFDRHNGQSGKRRALTAKRVARWKGNAKVTQRALPREEKRREETPTPFPPELDTPNFRAKWQEWVAYRKEAKLPCTPRAFNAQLKKAAAWGEDRATEAIDNAIAGTWKGLYEPKVNANGRNEPEERHLELV